MTNTIKNWQKIKLGDYFEVTNGKTNSDDAVLNGAYPLFDRSTEIKRSNKFLFDTEAIIVPGEGKEFISQYYFGKFDLHQRAYAIYAKNNNNNNSIKYLYYWIDCHKEYLSKMAVGSTVKSLRIYMLQNFPIELPNYNIQQKIAEILSSIDDAIQKTDQIIQKAELLRQGMMRELLTKGIGHKKFKKTKLGEIPEEWNIKELNQITFNITDGKHGDCENDTNSGYYFISVKDIRDGQINYQNARQIKKEDFEEAHKRTKLEAGDLLLTNSGTIGRMAVISNRDMYKRTTFQKSVAVIKPDTSKINVYYLMYALTLVIEKLITQSTGSAQANLLLRDLRAFNISLPTIQEQNQICATLQEVDTKIYQENSMKTKLLLLKSGIMQDIFSQKVHIN